MKSIVVTGVSSGIGKSIAALLIQKGFRVFGSVRKQADAERLAVELGNNFIPLLFDVTDEVAARAASEQTREALNGETLFGLVNNAGVAVGGPFLHIPIADFRRQLEINVVGQLIVSQAFVPLLRAQNAQSKAGRVVNITSVSGKEGSPFLGAYSASKFALEGLSESMRREAMRYGIDVIVVAPGPIATPIWDKAEELDIERYRQTDFYESGKVFQKYSVAKGRNGLPPEAVSRAVYAALTQPRPRTRYAVNPHPFSHWVASLLPKRLVDKAIAKALGFIPK